MPILTDAGQIRAALDRVLGSVAFSGSERRMQLLRFLIEQTIEGEAGGVKEAVIALEVFGRQSYDPKIDAAVRVEIARLRSALAKYYATDGADDPVEIEIPRGRYAPLVRSRKRTAAILAVPEEAAAEEIAAQPIRRVPASGARVRGRAIIAWTTGVLALLILVAVGVALSGRGKNRRVPAFSHSESPEAKDLYLKGRYYWTKRTPDSLAKAVDCFTQAIVVDPNFARAYVGLADSYNLLREFGAMPANEAFPRAMAAAKRAVALDDSSAEAHSSLAFDLFWSAWDVAGAEREFKRAQELNPNYAPAHHWYATSLLTLGRYGESMAEVERARELDPASAAILADQGLILFYAGKRDQAVAILKQVENAEPAFLSPHTYLAIIYFSRGPDRDFISEERKIAALSRDSQALVLVNAEENGLKLGGHRGMLESRLQALKKLYPSGAVPNFDLAQTCTLLGRRQEALDYLWASFKNHENILIGAGADPLLRDLHGEKSFRQLLTRIRVAPLT